MIGIVLLGSLAILLELILEIFKTVYDIFALTTRTLVNNITIELNRFIPITTPLTNSIDLTEFSSPRSEMVYMFGVSGITICYINYFLPSMCLCITEKCFPRAQFSSIFALMSPTSNDVALHKEQACGILFPGKTRISIAAAKIRGIFIG